MVWALHSGCGSFRLRRLTSFALLRFHLPLIEPDAPVSRIRLSEKGHAVAHGTLPRRPLGRSSPSVSCKYESPYAPALPRLCLRESH